MTDDIVKRLRRDLASGLSASIGDTQDAADRIEELERQTEELSAVVEELIDKNAADRIKLLEGLVSYLAGTNKDHVRVMLAGNPIVCDEIIAKSRAALGETDE